MYVYIHMYIYNTYIYICMCVRTYVYIHTYIYLRTNSSLLEFLGNLPLSRLHLQVQSPYLVALLMSYQNVLNFYRIAACTDLGGRGVGACVDFAFFFAFFFQTQRILLYVFFFFDLYVTNKSATLQSTTNI